jgi:hypothetical protein
MNARSMARRRLTIIIVGLLAAVLVVLALAVYGLQADTSSSNRPVPSHAVN